MKTFVAKLLCPICQEPITTVREDERGVDLPYCCDLFWRPQWKKVNGQLRIDLNYYRPDDIPNPNMIHENEIRESTATAATAATAESAEKTPLPQTSVDTSTAVSQKSQSTAAMKIKAYLIGVNAEQTAKTADIQEACQLAKSSFKFAMDQLIKEGEVEKVGHGLYRLRR